MEKAEVTLVGTTHIQWLLVYKMNGFLLTALFTSGCCVALGCEKLCGWVYHCVKGTASAGYMETYWRFQNVLED